MKQLYIREIIFGIIARLGLLRVLRITDKWSVSGNLIDQYLTRVFYKK
jgi:hypothetical protein